jgi:excinuclease UvrABC helicase subunit UvrB
MFYQNHLFYKILFDFLNEFESKSSNDFFGDFKKEKISTDSGLWDKESYASRDGSIKIVKYMLDNESKFNDVSELKNKLEIAVEKQDFETAAILRDKINSLKNNKQELSRLEKELDSLVKEQNFEEAIEVRNKINSIKNK